jgi:hypothetical protein
MHILITGGAGLIGHRLVDHLIQHGHLVTVVSRQPYRPASLPAKLNFAQWDGKTAEGWGQWVEGVDAVVNLAGAGLADVRWTAERKQIMRDSRFQAGQAVTEAIEAAENKPKVLIQASAVGYYGPHKDEVITEASSAGDDFLADICKEWEASTRPVEAMGVRWVVIRSGVVLDMQGGAFPKMVRPFQFFVGGPVGSGRQWLSWIHHEDEVNGIRFLIEHESASGPVNLTAPEPLRNRDFGKAIGRVLSRPALAPVPSLVLKLLFGEMASVLLDGQRVLPRKLQEWGYEFKFPTAETAMQDLLG